MKYSTGDQVMLKSGGPVMTVVGKIGSEIRCSWFDNNLQVHWGSFNPAALDKVL